MFSNRNVKTFLRFIRSVFNYFDKIISRIEIGTRPKNVAYVPMDASSKLLGPTITHQFREHVGMEAPVSTTMPLTGTRGVFVFSGLAALVIAES